MSKINSSDQATRVTVKQAIQLLLTLMFLFVPAAINAQQVHTYTDADSLAVGDLFNYTIVLRGNYQSAEFPEQDAFEEDLLLQSMQRFQTPSGADSVVYNLQFFAVEDLVISRKEILLELDEGDTTLTTTPVPLAFKSVIAGDDQEFRPLKPIFEFARRWWPFLLIAMILAVAGFYLYKRYYIGKPETDAKPEPEPAVPFRSPLDDLKESIRSLPPISSLGSREEYEKFYIQLGDSIRRYIKQVYSFPALEMTTTEISIRLQDEHASPKIVNITRKVLSEADIVKFANFHPGPEQAESALQKADLFIETAEVVNREQIQYLKYRYETEQGLKDGSTIKTMNEQ